MDQNEGDTLAKTNRVHFSSKTVEWETPEDFFSRLDAVHHFDLDPCATPENAKCEAYFTVAQNGLAQTWKGRRVFMNPPYGAEIGKWVEKAATCGAEIVVALLPARTDTRWFHLHISQRAEVNFVKGRLRFGNAKHNAPFPCMVVIWRSETPASGTVVVSHREVSSKGGKARAKSLPPKRRQEIARLAALTGSPQERSDRAQHAARVRWARVKGLPDYLEQ